jgi:fatty acid desaturase
MQTFDYKIDNRAVKTLSQLTPWRTAAAIAFDWLVVAITIAASVWLSHPIAYVAAVFIIGGRMHALGILIHEFAHYRFISNKAASEWVGDIFLAWPLGTTVDSYRKNHLAHHRYTNTDQDPDWVVKVGSQHFTFPQKWQYALANVVGYLVTINSIRDMRSILARLNKESDQIPRPYKLKRLAFYVAVLSVIGLTGSWLGLLMYWIVPYFTVFLLFLYLRSVAEHFGSMDYEHELGSSRTVYPHLWEKAFFAPHNVNYHLDHHLYPSVPFYNLPQLHALLLENPQYRENAHITRGYSTGVVRECLDERQGVVTQPAE